MQDVTRLLNAIVQGDPRAADQLLPLVYDELRRLAARKLAQEKPGQTLSATALVHEAYLRLAGEAAQDWDSRGHFFAAAAEAMRRILVESARRKKWYKHGGGRQRVPLDAVAAPAEAPSDDLLALDEALTQLAAEDPVKARLVELRFFAGRPSRRPAAAWASPAPPPTATGPTPAPGPTCWPSPACSTATSPRRGTTIARRTRGRE